MSDMHLSDEEIFFNDKRLSKLQFFLCDLFRSILKQFESSQ